MLIPKNSVIVNQNTNVQDLKSLLANQTDAKATKLAAKYDEQGNLHLFFKTKDTGIAGTRLNKHAEARRELSKDALGVVLNKIEQNVLSKAQNKEAAREMFGTLYENIAGKEHKSLNIDDVKNIVDAMDVLHNTAEISGGAKNVKFADTLATEILPTFDNSLPKSMIGTADTNKMTKTPMPEGRTRDLPQISHGGKTYEPVKGLASGGAGTAVLYRNVSNHDEKVVLKIPNEGSPPEVVQKFEAEAVMHGKLAGGANTHPNLLQMMAGIRLDDNDTPAVLMQFAPHGTVDTLAEGMRLMEGNGPGKVPTELANAVAGRLGHGIADGLSHLHDLDVIHQDLKGPNVMIDEKGNAVIMDFGETQKSDHARVSNMAAVNPIYLSPEIIKIQDLNTTDRLGQRHTASSLGKKLDGALTKMGANVKAFVKELKQSITDATREVRDERIANRDKGVDMKAAEIWGFGTIMARLFTGHDVVDADNPNMRFKNDIGVMVRGFDRDNPIQQRNADGSLPQGALLATTGDKSIDGLLTSVFQYDSEDRPVASDLVDHPVLNVLGQDSSEIGAFVKVMSQMAELQIKLAKYDRTLDIVAKNGGQPTNGEVLVALNEANANRDNVIKDIAKLMPQFEQTKANALQSLEDSQVGSQIQQLFA